MIAYTIEEINKIKYKNSALIAIEFLESKIYSGKPLRMVKCKCVCGKIINIPVVNLIHSSTSCGCLLAGKKKYPKALKVRYSGMICRCYNKKTKSYNMYGGKGVTVCDEWLSSPESFYEWAIANGYQPHLQLDKDIVGNGKLYSPATCCFVTQNENNSARVNIKRYEYMGSLRTLKEISDICGVDAKRLYHRIEIYGKSLEEAVIHTDKSAWYALLKKIKSVQIPEMETKEYSLKAWKAKQILNECICL